MSDEKPAKGLLKEEQEELVTDLDAFAPDRQPRKRRVVRFRGKTYALREMLELELAEVWRILDLEDNLKGQSFVDALKYAKAQVRIICPEMPEEVVDQLTGEQIIRMAVEMYGAGPVDPKEGSEGGSDSGT